MNKKLSKILSLFIAMSIALSMVTISVSSTETLLSDENSEGLLEAPSGDLLLEQETFTGIDSTNNNNAEPGTMDFNSFTLTSSDEEPAVEPDIPQIRSTTIVDTGMGLTESFKILFDTPMNFESLSNVKLYKDSLGGTQVQLTPSLSTDRLAAYFSHVPLEYNTTYVLSIPDTVLSSTYGAFEGATYTFTTISKTAQHENVVWFEDFDTRTGWDETERRAGWGMAIKETIDGVLCDIGGASNLGDRDNIAGQKAEFREGGIMFTKPLTYGTSNFVHLTLPFTGYTLNETADYVAVEFDYYQEGEYGDKYSSDVRIQNEAENTIFALNFGSPSYGFQYHTLYGLYAKDFEEYPDFQNKLLALAPDGVMNAEDVAANSISNNKSHWIGTDVKIQILFDVKNSKYIVNYFIDNERYEALNGWEDMVPAWDFNLNKITFTAQSEAAPTKPDVIVKYDNVAIVEYSSPEVAFTSVDAQSNIETDEPVTITFTEPMMEETLKGITLKKGSADVENLDFELSPDGKTVTLICDELDNGADYTLTVPETVMSEDYFAMAEEYTKIFTTMAAEKAYTFTTKTAPTPPIIVSASITDGETGVPVTSEFTFTFDKAMNTSTFDNITLVKVEGEEETSVSLYPSASNGDKTVRLGHPKLDNGKDYILTIPTSVKAVNNLALSNEVKYTFTTANVAEGETLLYGQYFDTAIGGVTETQARYQDGNWNIYSKVENETACSDTNKVEFKDGKMVITKEQRITGAEAQNAIYAKLDLSKAANMPETGVVAIEYDINYSKKPRDTWYTDAAVSSNAEITRLCFASGSFGWIDKSVTDDIRTGTKITTPSDWLEGKDIHVKLVYNLDDKTYTMFYTVDGVTYQSPVGVAPFRNGITSTKITKLKFSYIYRYYDDDPIIITLDNVEVKKLTKPVVDTNASSVVNGQSGVSATGKITLKFNADMNTNYFKDIKIYEGEVAPQNVVPTTSVFEDSKTCFVYLDKGLKYSTRYVIDIPTSVVSKNLIPVAAKQINFYTEAPQIGYDVEFVSVKNERGTTVTDIRGLKSVKAEVLFTNEMCACLKAPKLIVALCDSEGNIKSISYRETPVYVGSPQTVVASFTSTIPFESGDCLKAYVLDGTTGSIMSREVIYN
ncbi:MAG: Ig-like domain-containing protein [Clostridia bacterium]|nr:Ig-like domain-containing protein [Clostridia bacterium]